MREVTPPTFRTLSPPTAIRPGGEKNHDFHVRMQRKPHVDTFENDCLENHKARLPLGQPSSPFSNLRCRPSCCPLHRQGHPAGGLVMVRGTMPPQQTPRSNGVRLSCDRPLLGQTRPPLISSTRETRACGFVLADDTRLVSVEQHRPWREDDERQPRVVPDILEEQRVDFLQAFSKPNLGWSDACLNFDHFDVESRRGDIIGLPSRKFIVTPTVCPPLNEFTSFWF